MRFLLGRLWLGYSAFRCCCSPAGGGSTPAADTPPVQCLLGRESADSRERPALTRMGVAVHDRGVAHKEKVAPSRVGLVERLVRCLPTTKAADRL